MKQDYLCRCVDQANDQVWREVESVEFRVSASGEPAAVRTEARLAWNREEFFVRIVCAEPHMDQLKVSDGDALSIWEDDSIELFLDVRGQAENYFQLIVNAGGRSCGMDDRFLAGWNSQARAEVRRGEREWVLNLTFPFQSLGVGPIHPGDHWRINLVRNRPARDPDSDRKVLAWSPTLSLTSHQPKRFGLLFFADGQGRIPEGSRGRVKSVTIGYREKIRPIKEIPSVTPKADQIESLLTGTFWEDPPGWLMTFVVLPEKREMRESDFEGQWTFDFKGLDLPPPHVLFRHEDTMMTTGPFLGGLARKLAVREDPATRAWANRCVRGLYHVYELGREIERGFTPKPYGGKCSKQFSPDNFDNYYLGLGQYYPLADERHRRLIEEVICESASYWIRHRHACPFPYFDYGLWDNEKDPDPSGHWPLFWMPLYRLAYTLSKDPMFEREYHRLDDQFLRLGRSDADTLKAGSYHRWVPQLAALMEWAPEDRNKWTKGLEQWRRLIFECESVTVSGGNIRCGEAIARYLSDGDLARYIAREITELTEDDWIYAAQWDDPGLFPRSDSAKQIYWRLLSAPAEPYFAIWDGQAAGIWK